MLSCPFQNRYWRLRVDLKLSLCLHAWLKATELASWHPRPAGQLRAGARYWQDRGSGLPAFPLSTLPPRVEIALGLILLTEKTVFSGTSVPSCFWGFVLCSWPIRVWDSSGETCIL